MTVPQVSQVSNVGKFVVAGTFLLGVYLLVSGLVRLLRKGEVRRTERYRPMARIAFGLFLMALPILGNLLTRSMPYGSPMTNTQGF